MKKIVLFLSLTIFTLGYSQEKEAEVFKRNEIKINAFYLIAGALDVSYERILNKESGLGGEIFISLNNALTQKISLTGFYRYYFGKKIGSGFFVEGFGSLNQFDNSDDYTDGYNFEGYKEIKYNKNYSKVGITDFALGFGAGSKWITKKGIVFELYAGIGRNLFNDISKVYDNEIMGRGGINIGYRY